MFELFNYVKLKNDIDEVKLDYDKRISEIERKIELTMRALSFAIMDIEKKSKHKAKNK